jgi:hypothetical protein
MATIYYVVLKHVPQISNDGFENGSTDLGLDSRHCRNSLKTFA